MKALSIKQPWVELILRGIKDVENRTWRANHRGLLLIHTSKKMDPHAWRALAGDFRFDLDKLTTGAIVGVCAIDRIILRTNVDRKTQNLSRWHEKGMWGWYLKDVRRFDEPIPYKGALKLFDVPDEVVAGEMI